MKFAPDQLARRTPSSLDVRPDPLAVRWSLATTPADGFALDLGLTAALRVGDSDADRRLLAEAVAANPITVGDVRDALLPAVRDAAASVSATRTAADLLSPDGRAALRDALSSAAKSAGFSRGVEVLGPFELTADSPAHRSRLAAERARLEEARRQEAAHDARMGRVRRTADLLATFRRLRAEHPDLDPAALLARLDPADRPAAFDALARTGRDDAGPDGTDRADGTQPPFTLVAWAVSGSQLVGVCLDRASTKESVLALQPDPTTIDLPPSLGPARSVTPNGAGRLLVGGRDGVALLDPAGDAPVVYPAPPGGGDYGFNSAATTNGSGGAGCLWATHAALGVVAWDAADPGRPPQRLDLPAPADAGARCVTALPGGRLVVAVGPTLYRFDDPAADRPAATAIDLPDDGATRRRGDDARAAVAVVPVCGLLAVVRAGGRVDWLDADGSPLGSNGPPPLDRPHPLSGAAALPWAGSQRLLLALSAGDVEAVGPHDPVVSAYRSPHRGVRAIAAGPGVVVAVSPDRQRLVVWDAADGSRPSGDVHLSAVTRHRIADVAVVA